MYLYIKHTQVHYFVCKMIVYICKCKYTFMYKDFVTSRYLFNTKYKKFHIYMLVM